MTLYQTASSLASAWIQGFVTGLKPLLKQRVRKYLYILVSAPGIACRTYKLLAYLAGIERYKIGMSCLVGNFVTRSISGDIRTALIALWLRRSSDRLDSAMSMVLLSLDGIWHLTKQSYSILVSTLKAITSCDRSYDS